MLLVRTALLALLILLTSCANKTALVISGLDMDAMLQVEGGVPVVAGSTEGAADRGVISVRSPSACLLLDGVVLTEHAEIDICIMGVAGTADVLTCADIFRRATECGGAKD